jgi:hypothetical protein
MPMLKMIFLRLAKKKGYLDRCKLKHFHAIQEDPTNINMENGRP